MEYLKDIEFELKYHPRKANVVADALSRKDLVKAEVMMHTCNLYKKFRDLNLNVTEVDGGILLRKSEISYKLRDRIVRA